MFHVTQLLNKAQYITVILKISQWLQNQKFNTIFNTAAMELSRRFRNFPTMKLSSVKDWQTLGTQDTVPNCLGAELYVGHFGISAKLFGRFRRKTLSTETLRS